MTGQDDARGGGKNENGQRPPLPPPAFPPGSRRHQAARAASLGGRGVDAAFILPDDPMPGRVRPQVDDGEAHAAPEAGDIDAEAGGFEDVGTTTAPEAGDIDAGGGAFISPDDPLPSRDRTVPWLELTADQMEDVVVTGMGDDAHLDPEELSAGGDFDVMMLTEKIAKLAESLKRKGEAGLRSKPDMDRFDVTLRAYCVGYLAGRRSDEGGRGEFSG